LTGEGRLGHLRAVYTARKLAPMPAPTTVRSVRRPRLVLLLALALAACGGGEGAAPRQSFPALSYSFLKPLHLNVASVTIEDTWAPQEPGDLAALSPEPPADALRQMAQDRLVASGNSGRAVFRIEDASIERRGDQLVGHAAVLLDVYTSDGTRSAYAEARVARTATAPPVDGEGLRPALYAITKQMMDDMNVEFEYQVRRTLHDWLQETSPPSSAVPAPVQEQPLPAPGT
jgi:hypothetical protein